MARSLFVTAVAAMFLIAAQVPAQDGIQKGQIKKVDADGGTVVIAVDGKDMTFKVSPETRMVGADNQELAKRLEAPELKVGAAVFFKTSGDDSKLLAGLRLVGDAGQPAGKGTPGKGAAGDIRTGKITALDLDKMTITLTDGGKDRELALTEKTQVLDAQGATLKERLQGFKAGADVMFKAGQQGGKDVLVGIKLGVSGPGGGQPDLPRLDTSRLKPLTEMGTAEYQGFKGGLYLDGKNERPKAHEAAGVALAKSVQPLDADGKPSAKGKIVILSVGMSNTSQASDGFRKQLAMAKDINPDVLFVNGAVGGQTAAAIQDPDDGGRGSKYWAIVDQRLKEAGVTRAQVQAIWIKQADAGPTQGFPRYAKALQGELTRIVQIFPARFTNAKLVYLSSRTYGGYARSKLNPEPYAFESGYSVRWLIEEQLKGSPELNFDPKKGEVRAPWLSWGPYLWANGSTKRADGFSYDHADFGNDGTHHSPSGQAKVGGLLLDFFNRDSTTRMWFSLAGSPPPP